MGKGKRTADGLHIVAYENGTSQKLPAMLCRCDKHPNQLVQLDDNLVARAG